MQVFLTIDVLHVQELLGIEAPHLMDLLTVSVSYARGEPIRKHLSKKGSEGVQIIVTLSYAICQLSRLSRCKGCCC